MKQISNNKIYIILIGVSLFFLCCIVSKVELYADDFFYKSFIGNGFENFVEKNIEHYNEVNGRVLIHIIDQFVLNTNIYVYMAILIVCLIYDFYASSKFILSRTKYLSKEKLIYSTCVATIVFLFIDIYVLKETAFWITGAFNYIIPATISILAISNIEKILNNDTVNFGSIALLFVAGATTEQGFILTFLLTLGYIIIYNIEKKIILNKKEALIFILEILGFLTIFLSPASRARAGETMTIFNSSIIDLFEKNFALFAMKFIGENSIFIIISLLISSIALLTIMDKRINKLLLAGFLLSCTVMLINLLNIYTEKVIIITMAMTIIYFFIAIVEFFRIEDYRNIAIFLSSAFLLQAATFSLGELSYRSMFIVSFLSVIAIATMTTIIINYFKKDKITIMTVGLLSISSLIYNYSTLQGYTYNKLIFDKMRESINNYNELGFVEIDVNINNKYAHSMGYENGAFFNYFLESYGIKDIEKEVYFVKNKESEIYIDGIKLNYPALIEENNVFVPARFIVEMLGGSCEWKKETTKYYCDEYFVTIDNYSDIIVDCSDVEKIGVSLKESFKTYISRTYISLDSLEYIIDIDKNRVCVRWCMNVLGMVKG